MKHLKQHKAFGRTSFYARRAVTMLISVFCLLTPACMGDYNAAQLALYQMMLEDRRAARAAELVDKATPIVKFTFVDSGGQEQTLIVNRQQGSNNNRPLPLPQLKTPLDQFYPWFDRALSLGEKFIPFFAGNREKGGDTYRFGDGASFHQTNGSNSPLFYDWKTSWEATTTTGE